MIGDSGQLSIDFLIGFSIFMITIIATATFASGLLAGLQSKSVDFDAVAYRTGVILAEDPGQSNAFPGVVVLEPVNEWEFVGRSQKDRVLRFGLSTYKSTPLIFSPTKLDSFDNSGIYDTPLDYQTRMIFGNYPYHYNVTVSTLDGAVLSQIGEPFDYYSTYGRIRRVVLVKEPGDAVFDAGMYAYSPPDSLPFRIYIHSAELFDARRGPTYWIDPMKEELRINLTGLSSASVNGTDVTLYSLSYSYYSNISGGYISPPGNSLLSYSTTDKGTSTNRIQDYVYLEIPAGYFIGKVSEIAGNQVTLRINYDFGSTARFNATSPLQANYANPLPGPPPRPELVPAVMEVRIW